MKVNVIQHINEQTPKLYNTVVIIDVFRATSTIVTALSFNAEQIIACGTIDEALLKRAMFSQEECLLVGEQNMLKPLIFNMGNSPIEVANKKIDKKTLIFTTTNGTRAIRLCQNVEKIYACSMLNNSAIAQLLLTEGRDFTIFCAGSKGSYAIEDGVCAGMLMHELERLTTLEMDDFCKTLTWLYLKNKESFGQVIKESKSYKQLISNNFIEDINFCLQENTMQVIPIVSCEGVIKKL